MLRKGRFRHRLLDDDFLKLNAPAIHGCLFPFLALWKKGCLKDPEIISLYILIFALFRRPQDFLGGELKELPRYDEPSSRPMAELAQILEELLPPPLKKNKSLLKVFSEDNLLNGFGRRSWRSIPISANRSLLYWSLGKYSLKVREDIPKPEEILAMQSQGSRCISLLTQLSHLQSFIEEGRDAWGFLIHDLIHADHFFFEPQKAQAQIHFSQKLQSVWQYESIQNMMRTDAAFRSEFHYLMSDMNSVPLHLLKTFKAILLGYYKRQQNLNFSQNLPPDVENSFQHFFLGSLTPWNLCDQTRQAALRLNTQDYQGDSDSYLLDRAFSANLMTNA